MSIEEQARLKREKEKVRRAARQQQGATETA